MNHLVLLALGVAAFNLYVFVKHKENINLLGFGISLLVGILSLKI